MKNQLIRLSFVISALIPLVFAQTKGITLSSDLAVDDQPGIACHSEALLNQLRNAGSAPSPVRVQQSYQAEITPEVRVIYLVPSDVEPRSEYQSAITNAITHLQRWYWEHLPDEITFSLHDTIVETVRSGHDSNWFTTHRNGDNPALNLWFNSIAEASARFNDPDFIYVIYADIDSAGQAVGGTSGVALLPRHDLQGLAGQHPVEQNVCRWVGGLGHELGHALGLPHPPECDSHQAPDNSPPCQSLMYLGYLTYPTTHLTDEHKSQLRQSRFIVSHQFAGPSPGCSGPQQAGLLILSAVFDGKKRMTIEGSNFGSAPSVFINGKDRTKFLTSSSDSMLNLKAKKKKLGIKSGDNTVQVMDATGLISNIFTFTF